MEQLAARQTQRQAAHGAVLAARIELDSPTVPIMMNCDYSCAGLAIIKNTVIGSSVNSKHKQGCQRLQGSRTNSRVAGS